MDYDTKIAGYENSDHYSTFLLPLVMKLRREASTLDAAITASLINRIALSLPNPSRMRLLVDPDGTGRYDNFYPIQQVETTPDTVDAIDTFLNTYGKIDPAEEELLNRMIFNPVPDYAATLERENQQPCEPCDQQDILLDAFIAKDYQSSTESQASEHSDQSTDASEAADKPDTAAPAHQRKAPAGSLLSESLAKIFIKQRNYKSAYEIISSLSLNYPEKSIYFADQMRFLSKLIKIQEAQQASKKA